MTTTISMLTRITIAILTRITTRIQTIIIVIIRTIRCSKAFFDRQASEFCKCKLAGGET